MTSPKKITKIESREDRLMHNMDGFISSLTGAGYSSDKFASYQFLSSNELSDQLLEELYASHDIAAAIVDRIVRDALRSGYQLDWEGASDEDRRNVVDWGETTYGVTSQVEEARKYARLYGGGGVFMGVNGNLAQPAMVGDSVNLLRAYSSTELRGDMFYSDPSKQNYGEVLLYKLEQLVLNKGQTINPRVDIHESRIIPFYGVKVSRRQTVQDKGWGKSVLHRVYDLLKKFDSSFDSVLHTLAESSIPVYKVKALLDLLASENGELLAKRFELINTAKSAYRAVILDMEETFERVEASLSEASNVVTTAMVRVSGAAGMPSTILWGMQPAGQNATGASDLENWNQQVASEQSLILGPAIRKIYTWLLAQPGTPLGKAPEDLKVVFPAVETPSRQELANEYSQIGGTDAAYIAAGVLTPEQVALSRTEGSGFFPKVDKKLLKELLELRTELLLNPPEPMAEEPASDTDPEQDQQQDSLVFTRDGHTYIKSGDSEYLVGGDDE